MCNQNTHAKEIEFQFALEDTSGEKSEYTICIAPNANNLGIIKDVILKDERGEHHLLSEGYQTRNIFFLEKTEAKIADSLTEANVRFALNAIRQFASDFQSISAHRISPTRHMLLSGGTYENIGDNGQNTYQMLYAMSELKGKQLELVQNWLKHFGYSYHWRMSGKNQGEFLLKNLKTNVASNIVDNGFGISQSLPIILALSQLYKGTILLDSPEAFLQTKMQAELADMLIEGSQKGNLLVETGSEYLTICIQRRIAEQKLSEKEVSFYFIYENEKGNSNIEQITISKYGMFEHASEKFLDFFSENYNDILARDEARKKHIMEENNHKCT